MSPGGCNKAYRASLGHHFAILSPKALTCLTRHFVRLTNSKPNLLLLNPYRRVSGGSSFFFFIFFYHSSESTLLPHILFHVLFPNDSFFWGGGGEAHDRLISPGQSSSLAHQSVKQITVVLLFRRHASHPNRRSGRGEIWRSLKAMSPSGLRILCETHLFS